MKSSSKSSKHKFTDWEVGKDYECQKLLGSGSYGSVAMAIHKPTKAKVAIKRMEGVFEDETDCKRILREIKLLRRMDHPFVVKLFDIIEPTDTESFDALYIVLEYAESDLKKVVKSAIHLQLLHIKTVTYNLLTAVKYIHSCNVLHRDLKPANVLINEDCTIKVCDFGLARSTSGVESVSLKFEEEDSKKGKNEISLSGADDEEFVLKDCETAEIGNEKDADMAKEEEKNEVKKEKDKKDIRARLVKTKNQRKNMKRELTGHVVTRWYRAPELILLEKDYGPPIDVWSVGCIFGELLGMMKENAPTYLDRKPLFPGKSCFPLSPNNKLTEKRKGFPFSSTDQLNIIFQKLGTPSEDDRSFVTDQKAIEYLDAFPECERVDFKEIYKGGGDEALDLLDKFLQFNPYYRITLDEALEHPFLKDVRKKDLEKSAEEKISFAFEKEMLDRDRLRELFMEEIEYFKKLREDK
jgi:mitogen-activated protein kinase 1/3